MSQTTWQIMMFPVLEPWFIEENVAPAFVTEQIIEDVDVPMLRIRGRRMILTDCITTPMFKVLKAILACLLEITIENQLKRECLGCEYDRPSQMHHSCLY